MNDELLSAQEVADLLKVCSRQVSERYSHQIGFPIPVMLPAPKRPPLRWWKSEILEWAKSLPRAA